MKATQLSGQKLVEVFYNIYNGQALEKPMEKMINPVELAVKLNNPKPINISSPPANPATDTLTHRQADAPASRPTDTPIITQTSKTHPFVVEELEDNV